jgi:hypothetical protein
LSVLALDLDAPSAGWAGYLAGRGIAVVADDVGRPSIARSDARMLLTERRESEAQQARKREAAERRAIEQDQQFRATLYRGIPASLVPPDVHPASAMLQAARDERPSRTSVLQEALSGSGSLTFHPIRHEADES